MCMDEGVRLLLIILLIILIISLFPFIYMFQMMSMHMGYSFPFFIIPIILLATILLFFILLRRNENEKVKYVYPLLEEEKAVIKLLKDLNGKSTQKEIQEKLNLSKVKAHRILTRLESRGIVMRVKRGREMLVVLKEDKVQYE